MHSPKPAPNLTRMSQFQSLELIKQNGPSPLGNGPRPTSKNPELQQLYLHDRTRKTKHNGDGAEARDPESELVVDARLSCKRKR